MYPPFRPAFSRSSSRPRLFRHRVSRRTRFLSASAASQLLFLNHNLPETREERWTLSELEKSTKTRWSRLRHDPQVLQQRLGILALSFYLPQANLRFSVRRQRDEQSSCICSSTSCLPYCPCVRIPLSPRAGAPSRTFSRSANSSPHRPR